MVAELTPRLSEARQPVIEADQGRRMTRLRGESETGLLERFRLGVV
jgi:hypothetical protein